MKSTGIRPNIAAVFTLLLSSVLMMGSSMGTRALAQSDCQNFPQTKNMVCGKFLSYWQGNGALPQQGYPISGETQEVSATDGKTYTVQYFERAVFEMHPEFAGTENEVLLQLLGTFLYNQKYPGGAPGQTASTDNPYKDPVTGKSIGGKFRSYYEANGGLRQQGRPLSDEFSEKSDLDGKTYTVQYFERAVFELHPENAAPYDVLLSQLGTFRLQEKQGNQSQPTPQPTQAQAPPPTATTQSPTEQPTVQPPAVNAQFLGNVNDPGHPMAKPVGLALDAHDNLYVLSAGGDDPTAYVFEFDRAGQFIRKWSAPVEVSSGFNGDLFGDLDVDSQGNVYVAQAGGVTIEKYDNSGNHLLTIGGQGPGDGHFTRVISVAVDAQGNVYGVDDRRNAVQKFNSAGQFLLKTNDVHNTGYAATDAQGNVFIADFGSTQVKKFDSNLHLIAKWGGGLARPSGIDVDSAGNIYVANGGAPTVVKFDPTGNPVGQWGTSGRGPGQFNSLSDVTVDSQGTIYVADQGNRNVQKFKLP